ncbi:MAG: sulfite oxidase-like oxidoreductase [Deltaproteobacteria bacterium]|nr:sulfite oxidase-like oxidoreductase [Deltaproteobacteria bacterium]
MTGKPHNKPRVPPGQTQTGKFPVLDLGIRPLFDPVRWRFTVNGLAARPMELDWTAFQALPRVRAQADFHCVTGWSRLDVDWGGVAMAELARLAQPLPEARFVVAWCADGYTTNLPLAEALAANVLLADTLDGQPLPLEHGGPVRLVVPDLYAWKSAKFLTGLTFLAQDQPGYWEQRGYHNHGDPWTEERYG